MNDHNLDDLIIDNVKPKNSKAKSFLTIISLFIVVLIVAIILTKVILKDPNETNISLEDNNNTEMISPELRLQNVAKKKEESKEETKLSTIIEKELSEPVKAPEVKEIVETAEPVQAEEQKVEIPEKETPKVEKTEVAEPQKEEAAPKSVEITKEFTQTQTKPEVKESPKSTPVQEKKSKTVTTVPGHTYYIQVGSFSKTPSSRFLGVIKNSGFNYKITTSGKTKKLLIGPYKDRASANTALVRVKDRINKSAFVVKK